MNRYPSSEQVAAVRQAYPVGTRVELVSMNDPNTELHPGDLGTVESVDDMGTVFVYWDCDSELGMIYGVDMIKPAGKPTGLCCRRCGGPLYKSDIPEYDYQCFICDEDFYSCEIG